MLQSRCRWSAAVCAAALLGLGVALPAAAEDDADAWRRGRRVVFEAALTGFQEVPAVSTKGFGVFVAKGDRDREVLRYWLSYDGLEGGAVSAVHLHLGRHGTTGGIVAFLCSNDPAPAGVDTPLCPDEGEILEGELDAADVIGPDDQGLAPGEGREALRAMLLGATYVNVHTAGFAAGEVRGQLIPHKRKRRRHARR